MAESSTEEIIMWIQWIFLLLCEILCIYMIIQFVLNRNEYHICVRVPILTYIYCIAVTLMILGRMFLEPHNCPFKYCQLVDDGSYTQSSTVEFINSIGYASRTILLAISVLMKSWYLYYSLKIQILFLNEKWWIYINDKLNKNWWIKNMKKYGIPNKKMWCILILFMFIIIVLSIFGAIINPKIPLMITLLIIFITGIGMVFFYCKIPKINDIYGIKQEIKLTTIFCIFGFLYFPIASFASGGDEKIFSLSIINGFINGILVTAMVWTVTINPHKIFIKTFIKQSDDYKNMEMITNTSSGFTEFNQTDWISAVSQHIDILNNFMQFLCRSFCVENMLFIIETMQFKHEFIRKSQQKNIDYGILIKLYDEEKNKNDIPKSSIVYNDNFNEYSLNEQIRKIYDKYIDPNAMLHVNISIDVGNAMKSIILSEQFTGNQDIDKLIKIFDKGIIEIIYILNETYWKFQCELDDNQ